MGCPWVQYYTFEANGQTYYEEQTTAWDYQVGEKVKVEYIFGNPRYSRF